MRIRINITDSYGTAQKGASVGPLRPVENSDTNSAPAPSQNLGCTVLDLEYLKI